MVYPVRGLQCEALTVSCGTGKCGDIVRVKWHQSSEFCGSRTDVLVSMRLDLVETGDGWR
jgi:hypothetical protein